MPRMPSRSRVWQCLSSVLNSDRAIAVNIEIMRTFVRIRRLLEADRSLARRFNRIERKLASHDEAIVGIRSAIRQIDEDTGSEAPRDWLYGGVSECD
jgi:hypothetical protein